jgi:hypothetical protein
MTTTTLGGTLRDLLERLAYQVLNGNICDDHLPAVLDQLGALCLTDRMACFEELIDAIVLRDGLERGEIHWCQVIPEATGRERDQQALDAACIRVDDALAALVGGL